MAYPTRILDLTATASTGANVLLTWTAPSDPDGGAIVSYDIRYRIGSAVDALNWNSTSTYRVGGEPYPSVAGSQEQLIVSGLPDSTTVYFGMKSTDEDGEESIVSNSESITTGSGWSPVGKPGNQPATNTTKSGGPVFDHDLLIESTYQLLIGDGYSLLIQAAGDGTLWTEQNKQSDATFTNLAKS